jgi:hypothetical protein
LRTEPLSRETSAVSPSPVPSNQRTEFQHDNHISFPPQHVARCTQHTTTAGPNLPSLPHAALASPTMQACPASYIAPRPAALSLPPT